MKTCEPHPGWTTGNGQDQEHPRLTVQNLTFVDGNSAADTQYDGGGAIWVRGGRFKVINCRFFNNVCASVGPDVGGAVAAAGRAAPAEVRLPDAVGVGSSATGDFALPPSSGARPILDGGP